MPKYGRHIVSVEWNLHARSVLGGAPAAASASLDRIKEVLPTCDGFFMHVTHLRYGTKQVLEACAKCSPPEVGLTAGRRWMQGRAFGVLMVRSTTPGMFLSAGRGEMGRGYGGWR